tara:strand:+ start:2364 stop:2732 length:369 start_codon:yes stop_codon:yes gene_type:complete
MNTAIQNRNQSFFNSVEKMSLRRKTVYKIIEQYGLITSQQIKEKMKLGINQISGRVTELKQMCLVVEGGSFVNEKSNVHNTLWRLVKSEERINLINARYAALVDEQKQLENDYHLGVSEHDF